MAKLVKKYQFGGQEYVLKLETEEVDCFLSIDIDRAMITKKDGTILFSIDAHNSQGMGVLQINKVD